MIRVAVAVALGACGNDYASVARGGGPLAEASADSPCAPAQPIDPAGGTYRVRGRGDTATPTAIGCDALDAGDENQSASPEPYSPAFTVLSWTPGFTGIATLSTCGTGASSTVWLLDALCDRHAVVACADWSTCIGCVDGGGCGPSSLDARMDVSVTAGAHVYVFVDASGDYTDFTLTVSRR